MKTYSVVIPFFGKWPRFIGPFLKSCEFNPNLTVLFITDLKIEFPVPSNVKVIDMSFQEFRAYAERILEVPINLVKPYKLCDLKTMYGVLFADELKGFDYWGHADIDQIFGDLDAVVQPLMDKDYDVITFYKFWIGGAFTLYKNNPRISNLFRESPDWARILLSEECESFTECSRLWCDISDETPIESLNASFISMTHIVRNATREKRITSYFANHMHEYLAPFPNERTEFKDGKITAYGKDIFIYHFVHIKSFGLFTFPNWKRIPNEFHIRITGFYRNQDMKFYYLISFYRIFRTFIHDFIFFKSSHKTFKTYGFKWLCDYLKGIK